MRFYIYLYLICQFILSPGFLLWPQFYCLGEREVISTLIEVVNNRGRWSEELSWGSSPASGHLSTQGLEEELDGVAKAGEQAHEHKASE